MAYENLILEIAGGIAKVKINRPRALNSLNSATLDEIAQVAKELEENDEVRVVIITGEGNKAFVAGADIAEMAPMTAAEAMAFSRRGHNALGALEYMSKPVIAAVNGYALGGGFEIALACDFIYASDKARVGFPETTLGILPGFGGTQRTAKIVGLARAKELVMTGKVFTAQEAYDMGLVNKVVPHDQLTEAVDEVAAKLLSNGPIGVKLAKDCVNRSLYLDADSGMELEARSFGLCFATEDQKEGMGAFLEKRTPNYRAK